MNGYDAEEIVISGIGGHFPECDSLDELSHNLLNGIDMVTESRPRWEPGELDVPTRTGKMKSLEKCDAQYFGLIGKQCHALDPITRKVLERTYEAIFDAGINPSDMSGSKTGVFFGTSILETEMSLMEMKSSDAYNILGRNKTMNANRVSYWLNLNGPSFTLDSTWSSGLQALAHGFQYIQSGICEAAIVGAGSSIIHPEFSKHFSELNMLSPDGISRSFDEDANGYVRSEAVVVFVLQRLKNAKRVYGTLVNAVGKAMNACVGHILIPRQEEWLTLYNEFYTQCKINPKEVAYLEADGLACQEADTAELNAVNEFFCRERDSSKPLLIGSVKTNLGHTLSAAGLCSLAKVLIANQTGVIAPNLHFSRPNKKIAGLMSGKMKIVTEPTTFEGELIAVNDFGFGGTYGHCLIKRPPSSPKRSTSHTFCNVPRLILLSARDEEGIEATLNKVESLPHSEECIKLVHDVFSKSIAHHMFRGYTISSQDKGTIRASELFQGDKRPVWFVFSGMGSHWATMGKDLMHLPMFKESIDECHNVLLKKGLNLWNILTEDNSSMFDNILNSFVSISSMQIALVDILNSIGIKPDGIIGHSAGELGAAYADGCLTREEMILSSYSRGKVSNEAKVIKGMMAAIGVGFADIKDSLPDGVEVACHNSSTNCTISGPSDAINEFAHTLKEKGIFVKPVNVSNIAFHSQHIREMGPKLKEELLTVISSPKKRSTKWISSSVPQERWHDPRWHVCSADYLTNNLLSPVYFEEACKFIPKNAIVIELAPHSLLLPILKRSLSRDCIIVGLTNRSAPNQLIHVLQSIGKLYTVGLQPRVSALYPEVKLPVPVGTPFLGGLVTWDHSFSWNSKILSTRDTNKNSKDIVLYLDDSPQYKSFKLDNVHTLPYSSLLGLVLQTFLSVRKTASKRGIILEDIYFKKPVCIQRTRSISLSITNCFGTGKFEVMKGEEILVTGTVKENTGNKEGALKYLSQMGNPQVTMDEIDVYLQLLHSGYDYNEPLKTIKKALNNESSWECHVEWKGDVNILMESFIQCQVLASNTCEYLPEIISIREMLIEPHLLPESSTELRVTLDGKTEVLNTSGMSVKGLKLKMSERTPLPLSENLEPKTNVFPQLNGHLREAFVEYFARNVKSKQLGYSGTDSSGLKIMGIGSSNETSLSIEPDTVLRWQVPDTWNLEDAATIPLPYSLAYYMLKIVTDVKDHDSVLVTDGLSNIGLAAIRIALKSTKAVYATVSSEEEKEELSKKFKQLAGNVMILEPNGEDHIILDIILKTKKVSYIINTYPGKQLGKYLGCLSKFSQIFQVFLEKTEEGLQVYGTDNLIQQASIFGITLRSVLSSSPCDKAKLKELLALGIRSGEVVPLPKSVIPQVELLEKPESLTNRSQLTRLESGENSPRFIGKSQSSYLIVCGQIRMALQTVEWLIRRNTKKVTVVHSDKNISSNVKAKINAMQQDICLTLKQVEYIDEHTFKKSVRDVSNVDAAILLPIDEDKSTDYYSLAVLNFISSFLGPKGRLICLLRSSSRGVDFCSERSRNGMPTLALLWDGQIYGKLHHILQVFDRISTHNKETILQLIENDEEINEQKYIDKLLSSMPANPQEVADYAKTIPQEVNVEEIKTLSLASEYAKETIPVFLVQGIKKDRTLVEKFRRSLYPVFTVEIPHLGSSSVEELASYLVPKMKSVYGGPYVIIGEQWGGCVALELARQLEHLQHKTQVFLISGTPAEITAPLKCVTDADEPLEVNLLSRVLHIKDFRVLQELSNQKDWTSKVEYCSQFIKHEDPNTVLKGLDAIKCRLEALLSYTEKGPLNGSVIVVTNREIPSEYYNRLSKTRVALHEVSDREDTVNEEIFRMIHESIIHTTFKS